MVLAGSLANAALIIGGAMSGRALGRYVSERLQTTVMQGVALVMLLQGMQLAWRGNNLLLTTVAIAVGGAIGEIIDIEAWLRRVGESLQRRMNGGGDGRFVEAFVTASLVFCVGSMAVVGSIESGISHDHQILYTKGIIDGVCAVAFAVSLGVGVAFAALPVLLYQSALTLIAAEAARWVSDALLNEISAAGGLLIVGIGLNLLGITKIRVGNMLPAMVVAGLLWAVWPG